MQTRRSSLIFETGFRVFFLSAAFYAALTMTLWSLQVSGATDFLENSIQMPLSLWHAHELLFGVIIAVVAGFLTTAVPAWTNTPAINGTPLKLLFTLWLAGRLAITFSALLPAMLTAAIDLAFLPALAFVIARPIIGKKIWRNLGFVPLLLLIMGGNLLFHADLTGWSDDAASAGLRLSIGLLVLMTVAIGGRVVPFFTGNWLKRHGKTVTTDTPAWLGRATILSTLITVSANPFLTNDLVLGGLNYLTGVLILWRLSHWKGLHTLSDPLMWILHLGYALMGVGFLVDGLAFTTDLVPEILAQHIFTIGGLGIMILGMMSRIALGHTGRPLKVHPVITVAYFLLLLSLISRVLPPLVAPGFYQLGLSIAGASWIGAWLLYLLIYTPICLSPRPDGKKG